MNELSFAEENYIKSIYHLSRQEPASTTKIADFLAAKPASVTDMLKKLAAKEIIFYEKYKGVTLTEEGEKIALFIVRKHRLWEVFLVKKLNFSWHQVHEVAEQLEHIQSNLLIERLDAFLSFPRFDPHGDPIPDQNGVILTVPQMPADLLAVGQTAKISAVRDTRTVFLQYLDKTGLYIGAEISVLDKIDYDGSSQILIDQEEKVFVSKEVLKNLWVTKNK
jgi:DtxR family Mn-dependent transcriptional regulator